jgi:hypothetical protein
MQVAGNPKAGAAARTVFGPVSGGGLQAVVDVNGAQLHPQPRAQPGQEGEEDAGIPPAAVGNPTTAGLGESGEEGEDGLG